MTPRVRVSALQDTATAEDVLNLTRATGLSRFPVYRERLDEIVGMVHLKDALAVPAARAADRTPAGRIAVPPLLVPETLPGAAAAGAAAQRAADRGGRRRVRRHGRRGHPGGHRRGARRRGPRRARRASTCPNSAQAPPEDGPPRLGRRRRLPGRHPAPDRPGRPAKARTRRWPDWSPTCSAGSRPRATSPNCRRLAAAGAAGGAPPRRAGADRADRDRHRCPPSRGTP